MKLASVLLAVSCLLSAVKAQWAERTIPVPDSLNHAGGIRFVVFNPASQTVYAGGYFGMSVGASVVAIDAASLHKVADVPLTGHVAGLCVNPTNNKVYCALENRSFVSVIDAALNRVVYDIPTRHEVTSMCYNPTANKVYCALSQGTTAGVLVVDGATDSVLGGADTAWSMALCCNPVRNRVYGACYYRDRVVVIDGQTNEVVRRIPVRHMPTDVCYNSVRDKVYCAHEGDSCLVVIDCRTDSVVAAIKVSRTRNSLCYNPQNDRVYCIDYYRKAVTVIDGAGDSVLANVPAGYSPWVLCYNPADNCVYCNDNASSGDTVFVIDGATNAVVARVPGRGGTFAFCSDSARNQVFAAADYNNEVRVIDGATHRLRHVIPCRNTPYGIACDTVGRKFYCTSVASPGVTVLDGTTNTVLTTLLPDGPGTEIVCNSRLRKAYVPNRSGGMIVLDTHADTILRVIPGAAARGLCLDEDAGLLYGIRDTLSVLAIDCTGDSVLAVAGTQARPQALTACPGIDKVFVAETDWYEDTTMVEVFDEHLGHITTIPTYASWPFAVAYNPVQHKVYMSDQELLFVIDAMRDSVVSVLPMADRIVNFCYNTREDKVYCGASNVPTSPIAVIDGAADTVLAWVQAGQLLGEMLYEPYRNKVYCVNSQSNDVTVLDGAGDSVLTNITGFGKPRALAHLPAWNRIYVANYDSSSITVIRDSSPVGCEEAASVAVRRGPRDRPTIVRGVIFLLERGERRVATGELLDVSGREVLELRSGPNDVRALASGVYFVREAVGGKRSAVSVRKVVIQ